MQKTTKGHRKKQGATHPQTDGPPPVKEKDDPRPKKGKRKKPVSIPDHTLGCAAESVNNKALHSKQPQQRKKCQQSTDNGPRLPSDRLGLRRLAPGGRRPVAPGGAPGIPATGGIFPGGIWFLLCGGHGIILSRKSPQKGENCHNCSKYIIPQIFFDCKDAKKKTAGLLSQPTHNQQTASLIRPLVSENPDDSLIFMAFCTS